MTAESGRSTNRILDDHLTEQLEAAQARIATRYRDQDGITEEQIRDAFDRVGSRFADAQVRN
jgi:hypothetical protein